MVHHAHDRARATASTRQDLDSGAADERVAAFLAAADAGDGRASIRFTVDTPAIFVHQPGARLLIVLFHGAVDRTARSLPVFHTTLPLPVRAHQLSVFDSGLRRDDSLSLAWYAGHQDFAMQAELSAFVAALRRRLEADRVVFCGSSGGGFAALQQSWELPDSVALVGNPQTNLLRYHGGHVQRYLSACWPSLDAPDRLDAHCIVDCCARYAGRFPNTVVYLQSTADQFHLLHHMAPFLAAASRHCNPRVIVETGFNGIWGHADSIDLTPFVEWVRAIETSPDLGPEALLTTRDRLRRAERDDPVDTMMRAMLRAQAVEGDPGDRDGDLATAELVRDHHLRPVAARES